MSSSSPIVKILHVVHSLEPGGLENGVVNIANRLDRNRFQSAIVCLSREGAFADRLAKDVEVSCLHRPEGFHFSTVRKLQALIREQRPDVLHTHNLGTLIYGYPARRLSRSNAFVLHGEHASLLPEEKTWKRQTLRRALYRQCSLIHCVSTSLRDEINALGPPASKMRVTINGVDCERFFPLTEVQKESKRAELAIPSRALVLGVVGRFDRRKRHALLLRAFEKLSQLGANLHLLIIGDGGAAREEVMAMVNSSPARKQISAIGFAPDPAPFLQTIDLLVIPSEYEGLSNAMLESMACGTPCLTHAVSGAAEVISDGENGFIRNIDEPATLAAMIEELVQDPEMIRTAGVKAREVVTQHFSLESMIDTYSGLYEEASGRSRDS